VVDKLTREVMDKRGGEVRRRAADCQRDSPAR
jgi:hypothetical protein